MKLTRIYEDRRKEDRRKLASDEIEPPSVPAPRPAYEDEEISLVDLLIILARRKWLIASVFAGVLLLGMAAALLKSDAFTYTTAIQIAKGSSGLIESPGTVLAKLNESYIPFSLREAYEQSSHKASVKVSAKIPKDSQIISLESTGSADDQASQARLHQAVIDQLIRDHDHELDAIRLDLQSESNRVRSQLEALKSESVLLKERATRLDEQETFFQGQLADVRKRIDQNQSLRRKVLQGGAGDSAPALILLDSELARLTQRESELSEQLFVSINVQRDQIKSRELDNTRLQMDFQEKVEELNTKLAAIMPTRPITPTLRSLRPTGTGAKTIIAVSLVAGLMLGLFAAFFAEFIARAREKLRLEQA